MAIRPEFVQAAVQGQSIMSRLESEAREAWETALTAALLFPRAQAYADHLQSVELPKAEAEAAPYVAAVDEARAALVAEQQGIAAKLASYWSRRRTDPSSTEPEPQSATPRAEELRRVLTEAEAAAIPYTSKARLVGARIDELRNTPRPDCRVLERLGLGINVARSEGDSRDADR